jgi:hypothetical protein
MISFMFYCSVDIEIIKEDKIGGTCSIQWKMRNTYKILVGKPDDNRPLGKPVH